MKKTAICRLAVEVPARLALLSPDEFAAYIHAHWSDWRDRWLQVTGQRTTDAMFEIKAGVPVYLIELGGKHYLVTEGTKLVFAEA